MDIMAYNKEKTLIFKGENVKVFSWRGRQYREARDEAYLHDNGQRLGVVGSYYPDSGWAMRIALEDGWETQPDGSKIRENKHSPENWAHAPHLIGLP